MGSIGAGQVANISEVMLHSEGKVSPPPANDTLQVAIKTNQLGVLYYQDSIHLEAILVEDGLIDQGVFLAAWKTLALESDSSDVIPVVVHDLDTIIQKMNAANIFLMAHRPVC